MIGPKIVNDISNLMILLIHISFIRSVLRISINEKKKTQPDFKGQINSIRERGLPRRGGGRGMFINVEKDISNKI